MSLGQLLESGTSMVRLGRLSSIHPALKPVCLETLTSSLTTGMGEGTQDRLNSVGKFREKLEHVRSWALPFSVA